MKKKIILTSLMIFTSAFVLLSACGKKADNTSDLGGKSVTSTTGSSATNVASSSSVLPSEPEKPEKPAYVSLLSG